MRTMIRVSNIYKVLFELSNYKLVKEQGDTDKFLIFFDVKGNVIKPNTEPFFLEYDNLEEALYGLQSLID